MVTPFVLRLDDPRAADAAQVGPKAAHLSALAATCPVPGGFCVTADAYRHAGRHGGLDDTLREAVLKAYAELVGAVDPPPPVAVRSSALDEDGPAASFAGQHETVLGVIGADAVLEAIERTWRSLHAPAALAYRRAHGLPVDGLALAVLVQRLVRADCSGVAFSVDPVSGRQDRIVVNASWGLGESMVNGTVTPDTWHLDKTSMDVVESRPALKERMTISDAGVTREVGVPKFLQERPALQPSQLAEVAELARRLEQERGWPVDIEWAFEEDRLHLLQCRPVTTRPASDLAQAEAPDLPPPWLQPEDATRLWERDRLHFPAQITTLDHALIQVVFDHGLNHGMTTYALPFHNTARRFWTHHYACEERTDTPTEGPFVPSPASEAALAAALDDLAGTWRDRWLPQIEASLAFWAGFDLHDASLDALVDHLDATWDRLGDLWRTHFEIVVPLGRAKGALSELHDELFEADNPLKAHELLQGIDTLTTISGRRLWALRDPIAQVPRVAQVFATRPAGEVLSVLAGMPEAAPALAAIRGYLAEYGQRTTTIGLSVPTLAEEPDTIVRVLAEALARPDADLDRSHRDQAHRRESRLAEIRAALAAYPAPVRQEFEHRLTTAETAMRLGEDHNYLIDFSSTAAVRKVFLEFGRRFAAAGVLEREDDVVHMTPAEVRATAVELPNLDRRGLIAERRAEMARYADVDPPDSVGAVGDRPKGSSGLSAAASRRVARDGILTGTPGSSGVARGRARVIRTLADAGRLEAGEVLVAPTTSQPWMPLFAAAAALVTDTGGVLSHTAVVAREYHLPAVVGVAGATRALRDGMMVEVDGDRGLVRIVDAE